MYRAEEDYVKVIYELTYEKNIELIKPSIIAGVFEITDQSVNEMIKKLAAKKLLRFYPYKGVGLTKLGLKKAVEMVRAHRLWEVFLTDVLKLSWKEVHQDAEKLEHATSKKVLDALDAYLNYPKYCQHGNPIPSKDGEIKHKNHYPITHFPIGSKLIIDRVIDNYDLLDYLDQIQLKINDEITLISIDDFNHMMSLKKDENVIFMNLDTADMIYALRIDL